MKILRYMLLLTSFTVLPLMLFGKELDRSVETRTTEICDRISQVLCLDDNDIWSSYEDVVVKKVLLGMAATEASEKVAVKSKHSDDSVCRFLLHKAETVLIEFAKCFIKAAADFDDDQKARAERAIVCRVNRAFKGCRVRCGSMEWVLGKNLRRLVLKELEQARKETGNGPRDLGGSGKEDCEGFYWLGSVFE